MQSRLYWKSIFAALILASTTLDARESIADTTIAGQTYPVLPIETLIEQLRGPAGGPPAIHDQVAFRGRLFAPAAGLDTLRVPIDCEDVHFLDEVSFSQTVFLEPARFENASFAGGVSFAGARFAAPFALRGSRSAKHATFQKTRFDLGADLGGNRFVEVASFGEARFAGPRADFAQSQFDDAAYFERTAFDAPATFTDAAFAGSASFKGATFARELTFAGARFAGEALFWDARFGPESSFASGRADGEIAFDRARFGRSASFADFTFAQAAHFRATTFNRADFSGAYFRKEADFNGSEGDDIRLGAFFNRALDLSRADFAKLDLRSTDADSTFADNAHLYLQQPRLGRVFARWAQLRGHLAAGDPTHDLEPAYAALRQQFLLQGLEGDAEDCLIERLEYQRLGLGWGEPKRWAMELWFWSSDYGTDPTQLVIFIFIFILLFGLVYRLDSKSMRPAYGEGEPTMADCIGFSIYTFTHAGYRAWYATGHLKLLASIEALLGWISLGLLIAVALAHLL